RPALQAAWVATGLAPASCSTFGQWIHSPDGGVTLFPSWFCERQRDWPKLEMGDFPLYQAAGDIQLEVSLQQFLENGARPVVVFPGSASGEHGRTLLRQTLTACHALGLRVV